MVFHVLSFFCLEPSIKKEHLGENDFRHRYRNFFESAILEVTWSQLFKFFLNNYVAHLQQHLKGILQLKILLIWINKYANMQCI